MASFTMMPVMDMTLLSKLVNIGLDDKTRALTRDDLVLMVTRYYQILEMRDGEVDLTDPNQFVEDALTFFGARRITEGAK